MNERTKEKALKALDGMREIVRAEMLATNDYVEEDVSNPQRVKSICGGRRHCAVGSLWAGAGVRAERTPNASHLQLPGVQQYERDDFLRHRPGLKAAYRALNAAAQDFADRRGLKRPFIFHSAIEDLFEGYWDEGKLTKRDLLTVIASAKRKVKAA